MKGLPLWLSGKESSCNAGDLGLISGLDKSPGEGKGYPLQYSGLENPMDCIVHGVTKSRTQLSSFHFHAEEPPGKKEASGWAPVHRAPYLPHLKSTAGTRTPIQSRRCSPRRCRTPRAGPGHRQAAGLWVQSGFQFGLGLVSSNSGHPGEPPGESGGRRSEGAGEGSAAAAPAPAASTAGPCAAAGLGREVN